MIGDRHFAPTFADRLPVWRFNLIAPDRSRAMTPAALAHARAATGGVARFGITPIRH